MGNKRVYLGWGLAILLFLSCGKTQEEQPLFELLDSKATGISFANTLTPRADLNMLKYMYFYNGAGVGAGDFNNDGNIDLYFASNQAGDRIYLNEGNLRFRDVTKASGIPQDGGWSTGVSVVDINDDGMLDIYVCRVGNYASLQSHNLLLVCQRIGKDGIPVYQDQSSAYGLAFSGFSTQAAFSDFDRDGDLDMYLLNHSLRYNSTFRPRDQFFGTYDSLAGDRLYRNEAGRFRDVTRWSGINSSNIGYGLGICVSDINHDGFPDIYVANDFHENDYLYINRGDGSFRDELNERIDHTSQFSMGVDIADVNNDLQPEIITLDMLPEDPYILKRSLGDDEYNLYLMKLRYGYNHQFTRNNLQFNRGNGQFSEIGFYAGVAATDWSWSALWMDFDNDGNKDLFISNGIPKRLNDIDYVNYISNSDIQEKIRRDDMKSEDFAVIEKFPEIRLNNKFFVNGGSMRFTDSKARIGNDKPGFSNGAAYADLDNDGDPDLVVNNINDPAFIYRNTTNGNGYLNLRLEGKPGNRNALGTRVLAYRGDTVALYEHEAVRGFQSSMQGPMIIGTGKRPADSLVVIWPDNTHERLLPGKGPELRARWQEGLPLFNLARLQRSGAPRFRDVASAAGLDFTHEENEYVEFNREPLMPHMISAEGPALAVGDMDGDGLEDLFVGGARGKKAGLFRQLPGGRFTRWPEEAIRRDSAFEDVDAVWTDLNGDNHTDLVVASGGNEYYGADSLKCPRIYMNEAGKGFSRTLVRGVNSTVSCVLPFDFNADGKPDLFLGGRANTFAYGSVPESYIMINDGWGGFRDATETVAPGLKQLGMVQGAVMADVDGDRDQDLVLTLEWGGVVAFVNEGRGFRQQTLLGTRGWWGPLQAADLDGDGDQDLVVGNHGENARVRPTVKEPVRMYYDDFDGNGLKEQILTYYLDGQEIPFANKAELDKQMPGLKKQFLFAGEFAKAPMDRIIDRSRLNKAILYTAETFSNVVLINEGGFRFTMKPLPFEAQFSNYNDILIRDMNGDGTKDLVLAGNFDGDVLAMGRNDADHGTILFNDGKGGFRYSSIPGMLIRGEARKIRAIRVAGREQIVIARNNNPLVLLAE